jgi:nuclear RNA export factor
LETKQANVLDARISISGTALQVDGLKASKAASNPDGGLESLLGFLERKAAGLDSGSNRAVKIKKVCFLI